MSIIRTVTEPNPDPPPTLEAALERFSAFLASQGYPKTVCWLRPVDVLVDEERHGWLKQHKAHAAKDAARRYSQGLDRNLGIELRAICATETQTFAIIFVPQGEVDAEYRLMGLGLKLSCPVERYATAIIKNPLRWLALRLRNGRSSKIFRNLTLN
jgi:hypothetical protein